MGTMQKVRLTWSSLYGRDEIEIEMHPPFILCSIVLSHKLQLRSFLKQRQLLSSEQQSKRKRHSPIASTL
ncbi:hypothetical protein SLE2022_318770 [Rubroshorea leprosula]